MYCTRRGEKDGVQNRTVAQRGRTVETRGGHARRTFKVLSVTVMMMMVQLVCWATALKKQCPVSFCCALCCWGFSLCVVLFGYASTQVERALWRLPTDGRAPVAVRSFFFFNERDQCFDFALGILGTEFWHLFKTPSPNPDGVKERVRLQSPAHQPHPCERPSSSSTSSSTSS